MSNEQLTSHINRLIEDGRFDKTKSQFQHGTATIYQHSVSVAKFSCEIAKLLRIKLDYDALVKGALLHDYHLYNWRHVKFGRWKHGFVHPKMALDNAENDFQLTDIERNIIKCHMFPLTPIPPCTREGWVVCIADKICAIQEMWISAQTRVLSGLELAK